MTSETLLQAQTLVSVLGLVLLSLLEGWLPFFAGRTHRLRHGTRNVALSMINAAVLLLVFAGAMASVLAWAEREGIGLLRLFPAPLWVKTVLSLLLIDAWMYLWHRANHRVPFLWRFHRVHHSDAEVDVTTAARFHTGEIVLSSLFRLVVLPLLGASFGQLLLYEVLLIPVIQFHHSNVALPARLDGILRRVFVTPGMHRVHHSRDRPETDSNYSSIFSFWDRTFGTHRTVPDPRALRVGLDAWEGEEWQTVSGLLRAPFAPDSAAAAPGVRPSQEIRSNP